MQHMRMRPNPRSLLPIVILVMFLCLPACSAQQADDNTNAPLASAAKNGQVAKVRQLLDEGAPVDGLSPDGLTPLMIAANEGHVGVVRLLLDRGADVNTEPAKWFDRISALCWAVGDWRPHDTKGASHSVGKPVPYRDRMEIVKLLLDRTPGDAPRLDTLVVACIYRRNDVVKLILDKGVNFEGRSRQSGYTPLEAAAAFNRAVRRNSLKTTESIPDAGVMAYEA